jgi:radical SAM protein (TIGR01212 family)
MHRTYALSARTRQIHGGRVQKIPLDAGFSCPNRDGTISTQGCVFCNPAGSGSGMEQRGLTISEQWAFWRDLHRERHGFTLFTAYLQSYSNTHGPIGKLARTLEQLKGLPGLTSLNIGTRPDCLDDDKLDLLAAQRDALGLAEISLEMGLQSANDATLTHINRGHDADAFARAAEDAAARGLTVVAHVIAGLPTALGREGRDDLAATVEFINTLPVTGIKFHNLYVARNTPLAEAFAAGGYQPLTLDDYLDSLTNALMRLSPTTVVHRLNGNPASGELVAPAWAGNMRALHNAVRTHLEAHDVWQGKNNGAPSGPPAWFSPEYKGDLP